MALVQWTPPSNPGYGSWTGSGDFTLLGGGTVAKLLSNWHSSVPHEHSIFANMSTFISNPANEARVSFKVASYLPSPSEGGSARIRIWLLRPFIGDILLYDEDTNGGVARWALNNVDIKPYLTVAGVYGLYVTVTCTSIDLGGGSWVQTWVELREVDFRIDQDVPDQVQNLSVIATGETSLHASWDGVSRADSYTLQWKEHAAGVWNTVTGITDLYYDLTGLSEGVFYDVKVAAVNESGTGTYSATVTARTNYSATVAYVNFLEVVTPAETFVKAAFRWVLLSENISINEYYDIEKVNLILQGLSDRAAPREGFQVRRYSPLSSKATKLLAGLTTGEVKEFTTGNEPCNFDTDDLDFERPGEDKILDRIEFMSQSDTAHTVYVDVSLDSGLTWLPIGSAVVYKGTVGVVSPWITSEKFRFRFRGTGLHLYQVYATAVPVGGMLDKETN